MYCIFTTTIFRMYKLRSDRRLAADTFAFRLHSISLCIFDFKRKRRMQVTADSGTTQHHPESPRPASPLGGTTQLAIPRECAGVRWKTC